MQFELLTQDNLNQYLSYLKKAHAAEPELMKAETVDAAGIRSGSLKKSVGKMTSTNIF